MKPLDYILIAVFIICFIIALYFTVKNNKKGGCGGSCSSCPYGKKCSEDRRKGKK